MYPALAAVPEDPAADARLLDAIADCCQRYTPLVTNPPDGILLDISGCAHLFGGEEKLRADLSARLIGFGFAHRVAMAGTIGAAWAAARFLDTQIIASGRSATCSHLCRSRRCGCRAKRSPRWRAWV